MATETNTFRPTLGNWVTIIILSCVWGCSFMLIKKALLSFSALQVAALRMSISGLIFLPYLCFRYKVIDWSKWKYYMVIGFVGGGLPAICFAIAQQHVNSSVAGVLNALAPLFTLVFGVVLFKNEFVPSRLVGVFIGLIGAIALIFLNTKQGSSTSNQWYGMLCVMATMMYGISANTIGKYMKGLNSVDVVAVSYTIAGMPFLLVLLTLTDFVTVLQTKPEAWLSLSYMAILALVGTVLANIIFISLIQKTNALFGSMVTYMIPFVAILLGFLDHENIGIYHFGSMAMILGGVYITSKK